LAVQAVWQVAALGQPAQEKDFFRGALPLVMA
jgi:hypothetical protein